MRQINILIAGPAPVDLLITDHVTGQQLHLIECDIYDTAMTAARRLIASEGYTVVTAVNENPCETVYILDRFELC
jgi:hypothetical protein